MQNYNIEHTSRMNIPYIGKQNLRQELCADRMKELKTSAKQKQGLIEHTLKRTNKMTTTTEATKTKSQPHLFLYLSADVRQYLKLSIYLQICDRKKQMTDSIET